MQRLLDGLAAVHQFHQKQNMHHRAIDAGGLNDFLDAADGHAAGNAARING